MKYVILISVVAAALMVNTSPARERIVIGGLEGLDPNDERERYAVALALSGGGARGLAAIGVLKAFEEKGIEVEAVSGVSMGGIVGGLYAAGYTPNQLRTLVAQIDFDELFTDGPKRTSMFLTQREERERYLLAVRFNGLVPVIPQGLTGGQKLTALLTDLTSKANYHCSGDFDRLPVPFRAVSTDVVTGQEVIHDNGSLSEAMRATMAFPLAFTGLERNGQLLMDGGMVKPVPVDLARRMSDSVSFVVAVNTASPLLAKDDLVTPVDIANQVTSIMTADKMQAQLALADYTIAPALDGFSATDFRHKDTLMQIGYESGLAAADGIIRLLQQYRSQMRYAILEVDADSADAIVAQELRDRLGGRWLNHRQLVVALKAVARDYALFRLQADLIPEGVTPDGVKLIRMRISAQLPLRTTEVRFQFSGNTIMDDSTLGAQFDGGSPMLFSDQLRRGVERIVDTYHALGYDLAGVRSIRVSHSEQSVTVDVDEAIVRRVDIRGNERTKDWFVRTRFPLESGDPYSTTSASRGIADIYATDLFHSVFVELVPYRGGAIVGITVEEKQHRQARLGWHWDDEYKSEEFVELLDDDVGGIGVQLLLHGTYGYDRHRYLAGVSADRIFKTYLTGAVRCYREQLERHLFDDEGRHTADRKEIRTGGEVRVGQQIARLGTLSAAVALENVKYLHPGGARETFGLRVFKLESLVETFDRVPLPSTGKKHLLELWFAGEFLGGEAEFTRFFTSLEAYFPIARDLNYHPKLALGLSRSDLPVSEKFYLGGPASFVGFRTHQLEGDKMFLLSNELRLKLPLRFYLTARHDLGEVYTATDQVKLRNLRHGLGVLLTWDLPVGPLELGYGVADKDEERFYFSLGYSF